MRKITAKAIALLITLAATLALAQEKSTLTDTRDKKTYKTVKIGEQVWMAENLNFEAKEGSMCYDNKPDNCKKYGRLYNWATAMKACPNGWKLPSNEEWENLRKFAGNWNDGKLMAKGWNSVSRDDYCTNDYGFSALPGGRGWEDGDFKDIGNYGGWWSSTEYLTNDAYRQEMGSSSDEGEPDQVMRKTDLFSVRCIQN